MALHHLLKDRASINILKILYDNEVLKKKYSMKYVEVKDLLSVGEKPSSISNLDKAGLLTSENTEKGELVMSITQKGKDFLQQFDILRTVIEGKKQETKAYSVKYELSWIEQRILVICSKLCGETEKGVPLQSLTEEVYPNKKPAKQSGTISRYTKRLEDLNLISRVKEKNKISFEITEIGERVINEQLLEPPAAEL